MSLHRASSGQSNIHVAHAFEFADSTEREAGTGYTLTSADVYKIALQLDDKSLWLLTDESPITWVAIGAAPTPYSVRVFRSTAQTISTSSSTAVSYDTEIFDNGGMWAIGNPTRLVAPVTGIYIVNAGIEWVANATGARFHFFQKNGTTAFGPGIAFPGNGSQDYYNRANFSAIYSLTAADYVEVMVNQASGGNLNINTSAEFWPIASMALLHEV